MKPFRCIDSLLHSSKTTKLTSSHYPIRLASFSVVYSPPNRPISQPKNTNPAWTRICFVSHSAQHTASPRSGIGCQFLPSSYRLPPNISDPNRLRSSASYALYIAPLIATALIIYNLALSSSPVPLAEKEIDPKYYTGDIDDDNIDDNMEALPGRPGNLTPEQEEKLRKFWEMFLQVCGIYDEDGAEGDRPAPLTEQGKSATAGSEKSKKKSRNIFKKIKDKGKDSKNTDKESTAPATPVVGIKDDDDKWGESKAYHETLAKRTPEEIRDTVLSMIKHDNPDALLLRFLRARKWDVERALVMLVSSLNWRLTEMQVDKDIMMNGEEYALLNEKSNDEAAKKRGEDFLAQMRLGKSYCYGVDKAGRPICVIRARLHKAGDQAEESLERYTVYLIETTRFLLAPPVDTACVVFDLSGFSLANMDYSPVKFMIRCFEANYPESLGIVLVHKAPWVFQGIWRIIRGWLDPVVASKVNFTNNVKDMEQYIAMDKIPDEMDGTSGWTYKYIEPVAGENDKMKDTETRDRLLKEREAIYEEYENKTIEWIHEDDATKRTAIKAERGAIAQKLKEQYWRLDPYIRSRSLYDRIGVTLPDGKVDNYPVWQAKAPAPATTNNTPAAIETSQDDLD